MKKDMHRRNKVKALLKAGLTRKEMAEQLGCSVGTIGYHVTNILKNSWAKNTKEYRKRVKNEKI